MGDVRVRIPFVYRKYKELQNVQSVTERKRFVKPKNLLINRSKIKRKPEKTVIPVTEVSSLVILVRYKE